MQRQKHLGNESEEVRDGEKQKAIAGRPGAERWWGWGMAWGGELEGQRDKRNN